MISHIFSILQLEEFLFVPSPLLNHIQNIFVPCIMDTSIILRFMNVYVYWIVNKSTLHQGGQLVK